MPATSEQKEFSDFLQQIKDDQKNTYMSLFKKVFNYEKPDEMLQALHSLETVDSYIQVASSIENNFENLGIVLKLWEVMRKTKEEKILNVVNKILNFALNERKQQGQGLKMLTPNQILVDYQFLWHN